MDLEEEFKNLVDGMRSQVRDKENAGELTANEASELLRMISDRVEVRAWNNSGCYQGESSYDDQGWSPSMVC